MRLHGHHASLKDMPIQPLQQSQPSMKSENEPGTKASAAGSLSETAFAKVNSVVAGSPADDAGLRAGDRICRFDDVNWLNHERLSKVATTVRTNEGVSHYFQIHVRLSWLTSL